MAEMVSTRRRGVAVLVAGLAMTLALAQTCTAQGPAVDGRKAAAATPAPVAAAPVATEGPTVSTAWTSERRYEASWTTSPAPVPLLAFHEWTLTVRDAGGQPADGVAVEVRGGMPEHDHGLPSVPVVTPLGGGRYRVEGMRFHMPGAWVVLFTLARDGVRDTLRVELSL